MQRADIGAAMRLKQVAGWNQTYADLRRFLALEPGGSYVAESAGRVVGTVTTCSFGRVGWIGMMLVDPAHRRQGIARQLMQRALTRLADVGCTAMQLDATPLGAPLYRQFGFCAEQEVVRLGGVRRVRRMGPASTVRAFCWRDWPQVRDLDRLASGVDRTKLLKRLLLEAADAARVFSAGGQLQGFALSRAGRPAWFIGPVIAVTNQAGHSLLANALSQAASARVVIDIPKTNQLALSVAQEAGLAEQRPFERMLRGDSVKARRCMLWASSGPEKG
jgi:GNAT superfamily N-acetyltransferase